MHIRYLRFEDLRDAGIVRNRPTLYRWMNRTWLSEGHTAWTQLRGMA